MFVDKNVDKNVGTDFRAAIANLNSKSQEIRATQETLEAPRNI